jgi:phosphate-selective porin OprO/OprP
MVSTRKTLTAAASMFALLAASAVQAQEAPSREQLAAMQAKLDALQRQVEQLRGQVKTQEQRSAAVAADVVAAKGPAKKAPPGPLAVMTSGNRPGICTYDKFNCVYITSRLHFDVGAYNFRPSSLLTTPQNPHNGVNARRARIGLIGTFMRDWQYTIVGEFGGTQDGAAQLNNAILAYTGFKGIVIEGGYMDVPYTLDEQLGSNNILFMERATPQVLAVDLAAGDNRSAIGFRAFDKHWWFGSYLTGPVVGFDHTARVPVGVTARAVFVPVRNERMTWLVEADYQRLLTPQGANGAVPADSVRLRDRIEIRIDPGVRLLDTGNLINVENADVLSGGSALSFGPFYAQGEYFKYRIQRSVGGDVDFQGGYIQAAWVITGESRRYSESAGAFGGINPKNPILLGTPGWGAWELAVRYSHADLNDLDAATPVRGGVQDNFTLGLNWYVNQNVRFMFNWVHGEVERFNAANVNLGARYDAFASRFQIAF